MIQVSECFGPTVQGEGKSASIPCAFLRLANCSLRCRWCDTPFTWNFEDINFPGLEVSKRADEVHKMTDVDILQQLESFGPKFLIISGGEPFLQQRQLVPLLRVLKEREWWVEVETAGVVPVRDEFIALIDQVNCSPKLENSGNSLKVRRRHEVLKSLASSQKVNFKFVIQTESDLEEVLELCSIYRFKEVRLMPECRTKEELLDKESWLEDVCRRNGFIYCTRLSILQSGTLRGV